MNEPWHSNLLSPDDLDDPNRVFIPPASPPWRDFPKHYRHDTLDPPQQIPDRQAERAATFVANPDHLRVVRAALFLRRPLLITGKPGLGKTTLAHYVATRLNLGPVLSWPITSRTTLRDGLYQYDAVARLQELQRRQAMGIKEAPTGKDEGRFFSLGPLGTALLPWSRPRVLLIDEIDKSDLDFPNDLLHVLEEGLFEIPELRRLPAGAAFNHVPVRTADSGDLAVKLPRGQVQCSQFPFIIMTSNGERDLPPAFLRRCLRLVLKKPSPKDLQAIVASHFDAPADDAEIAEIARDFHKKLDSQDLATDQLLNTFFLSKHGMTGLDDSVQSDLSKPDAAE